MKYADIVVVKRWIPILREYEQTKAKVTPRPFKFVKNINSTTVVNRNRDIESNNMDVFIRHIFVEHQSAFFVLLPS